MSACRCGEHVGAVGLVRGVAVGELPPSLFFPPLSVSLTSGARLSAAARRREPAVGRAGARVVGHRVFLGQPTSSWLGFPICFVLFFFTDLGTDSKMYISWLVDPNDVVPILLSSW